MTIPTGVWMRGQGVGKTRIDLRGNGAIGCGPVGYSELSDLTIAANPTPPSIEIAEGASGETLLHDMEETRDSSSGVASQQVRVGAGARASLVNCRLDGGLVLLRTEVRVERSYLYRVLVRDGSPHLLGCLLGVAQVQEDSDPLFEGCAIGGHVRDEPTVEIVRARGLYRYNRISAGRSEVLSVDDRSSATIMGNRFGNRGEGRAAVVRGSAEIVENVFDMTSSEAVVVAEGARVRLEGNRFQFRGYAGTRAVLIPAERSDLVENHVYGLVVAKGGRVRMRGNQYVSNKDWGQATRIHLPSYVEDQGGNEVRREDLTEGLQPAE